MSKWLTTGQMIDQIKIGEIAMPEAKGELSVKRIDKGIFWLEKDGECEDQFQVNHNTISYKWRVLPRYVSFDVAMEALNRGKRVKFDTGVWFDKSDDLKDSIGNMHIYWSELLYRSWMIED